MTLSGFSNQNARPRVRIQQLPHALGLPLPAYQTAGAAGCDLAAALSETQPLTIEPNQRALVPTGLVIEMPNGMEAQVRPRSGLAIKHGVTVLNSPGTIDSDYRGELNVILINLGEEAFKIVRGDRIAQLIFASVNRVEFEATTDISETDRGKGGFGSTGT